VPFNEASAWVCLTLFGTGSYFTVEWWGQSRMIGALAIAVVGLFGLGFLVYRHHYPSAHLPSSGLWVWMALFLTWTLLGYAVYLDKFNSVNAPASAEIPDFDASNAELVISYGQDSPNSCFMVANGIALLSRQSGYKAALACFVSDGTRPNLDVPYIQVSNTYDIAQGEILMRAIYKPYFDEYRKQLGSQGGIAVALLNIPNSVDPSQFTTLRQARALGVKILKIGVASGGVTVTQPSQPAAR
jgi:hypothetical protein